MSSSRKNSTWMLLLFMMATETYASEFNFATEPFMNTNNAGPSKKRQDYNAFDLPLFETKGTDDGDRFEQVVGSTRSAMGDQFLQIQQRLRQSPPTRNSGDDFDPPPPSRKLQSDDDDVRCVFDGGLRYCTQCNDSLGKQICIDFVCSIFGGCSCLDMYHREANDLLNFCNWCDVCSDNKASFDCSNIVKEAGFCGSRDCDGSQSDCNIETPAPTPRSTPPPTPNPTQLPTPNSTESPVSSQKPTPNPTPPLPAPTKSPSIETDSTPAPKPPSSEPPVPPSPRPVGGSDETVLGFITVNKSKYEQKEDVVVFFDKTPPVSDDWIGIYRRDSPTDQLGRVDFQWTCGTKAEACDNGFATFSNLPPGTYQAHLLGNGPPPYESYTRSDAFQVLRPNTPAPVPSIPDVPNFTPASSASPITSRPTVISTSVNAVSLLFFSVALVWPLKIGW